MVAVTVAVALTGCPGLGDTVPEPENVEVTPPAVELEVGGTERFRAEVLPTGVPQGVAWTVEPSYAGIITDDGLLTLTDAAARAVVTVRATATDGSGVSGTATVNVVAPSRPAPDGVVVTPSDTEMSVGGTQSFLAAVSPAGSFQAVEWSVEPPSAGVISAFGVLGTLRLTGAVAGDTVIVRATAEGHPTVSGTAKVTIPEPLENNALEYGF